LRILKLKFRFSNSHTDAFFNECTVKNIFIDLTNRCNLNCIYCFNDNIIHGSTHDLPLDIIKKMLIDSSNLNISNWFLSGGEPILYPYLDDALHLFQKYKIKPKIASNGSLLTSDIVDKLISFGVGSIQFSIDTLNEDKFINLNCGEPQILKNTINNLIYSINTPLRIVVSTTLTKLNLSDIYSMMIYFQDLGVDSYTVYLYTPSTNQPRMSKYAIDFSELPFIVDSLIEHYYQHCDTKIIDTDLFWILHSEIYKKWQSKIDLRVHNCSAGNTFSVKVNGEVSPCICQNSPDFICGNLHNSNLCEILKSQKRKDILSIYTKVPECKNCNYLNDCRAGCRSNAYIFGKSGLISADPHCEFFRLYNGKL